MVKNNFRGWKMKTEIGIIVGVSLMILILGFSLFYSTNSFTGTEFNEKTGVTGLVTSDSKAFEELDSSDLGIITNEDITKELAEKEIYLTEKIIQDMKLGEFSVLYLEDQLTEAKRVFEQAKYAEILRGEVNVSELQKQSARKALKLINWKKINYSEVIKYTNEIKLRQEQAILLKDKIAVQENEIENLKGELYNVGLFSSEEINNEKSKELLVEIKAAFKDERFTDAEELLIELRDLIETEKEKAGTVASLRIGASNFFQRYWLFILILLVALGFGGFYFYKNMNIKTIKKEIRKMKAEKQILKGLMKKAQTERFKENKISGIVYNIRMKKYKEKLNEIKGNLPILESRLDRFINKKEYNTKEVKNESNKN
jgi:hypothetical protein